MILSIKSKAGILSPKARKKTKRGMLRKNY